MPKLTQKQLESKLTTDLTLMWDWNKEEPFTIPKLVVHRAYILLSSLILIRDFNYPEIHPTLRNTIQLEWSVYPEDELGECYLEFEVYEDKCSMLLAWQEEKNPDNPHDNDLYFKHFTRTFTDDSEINGFPMDIFSLFRYLEANNDSIWLGIKKWFIEGDN